MWYDGSTKICKANTLKYMCGGLPLPTLIPLQSNSILPNCMKTSPFLPVSTTTVFNLPVYTDLIYPSYSFPYNFVPATTIPVGTREVGGIDLLLEAIKKFSKYIYPLSDCKRVEVLPV